MSAIPSPKPPPEKPNLAVANVKFRFRYAARSGRWSCGKLSTGEEKEIINKLKQYQHLTVAQFKQSGGVRLKNINKGLPPPPKDLSEDIKNQLAQEFRISRKFRIFGYLMEDEFFLLWFDPNHKVTG